jgi:hypothetical protein
MAPPFIVVTVHKALLTLLLGFGGCCGSLTQLTARCSADCDICGHAGMTVQLGTVSRLFCYKVSRSAHIVDPQPTPCAGQTMHPFGSAISVL